MWGGSGGRICAVAEWGWQRTQVQDARLSSRTSLIWFIAPLNVDVYSCRTIPLINQAPALCLTFDLHLIFTEWSRTATQKTAKKSSVTRLTSLQSSKSNNSSSSSSYLVSDSTEQIGKRRVPGTVRCLITTINLRTPKIRLMSFKKQFTMSYYHIKTICYKRCAINTLSVWKLYVAFFYWLWHYGRNISIIGLTVPLKMPLMIFMRN